jgi:hypothetical protein
MNRVNRLPGLPPATVVHSSSHMCGTVTESRRLFLQSSSVVRPEEWHHLEEEFRDLQRRHPNLYASWTDRNGRWMGFSGPQGEEDRFRALLGLTGAAAGHSGGDGAIDYFLNLVKEYLLNCKSNNISVGQHATVEKTLGPGPRSPGVIGADPTLGLEEIYTIRPLCQALADYCLEREGHALAVQNSVLELIGEAGKGPDATNPKSKPAQQNDQSARAAARQAVVMPLLKSKGWTRGRWITASGVSKNCIYEYLRGTRQLSYDNRRAMAEVLGLKPEELPE